MAWEKKGYAHHLYAASFQEFGEIRYLEESGCSLLIRPIAETVFHDAMNSYPMCFCDDWGVLTKDLDSRCQDLVSVALVAEPFAQINSPFKREWFDLFRPYKRHYVADLRRDINDIVKKSHRETARRAGRHVQVRVKGGYEISLDRWLELWKYLVERHDIRGIKALSKGAFRTQFEIPGLILFEAMVEERTVGMDLWFVQGEIAYGHLAAFNEEGYKYRASYATKWRVINYFKERIRWLDFGGGAGVVENKQDGLAKFKQGWATEERMTYLLGKIIQPDKYSDLCLREGKKNTDGYFPAYRKGEMI